MISDDLRQKLREAAIKNKLGGDTTNQREYNETELKELLRRYIELDCKNTFHSLFTEKKYKNNSIWKNDVSRYLNKKSRREFFFMVDRYDNGPEFCKHCNTELGIDRFMTTAMHKRYTKYCGPCTESHVWAKNVNAATLSERGKNISASKKKFYATEKGKEVAKEIGRKNSKALTEFYKTEKGCEVRKRSSIAQSKIMKQKILLGEFTPNTHNSRTHRNIEYQGQKFRSAWEVMWYSINPKLLYETVRVEYNHNGKCRIYIVDFEDKDNKILYEIKPLEHTTSELSMAKIAAAMEWAEQNNYTFKIITQNELIDNLDAILESDLPEQIKEKAKKLCRK